MPTRPLPTNPSLEHLRKDAKRLRASVLSRDTDALARVKEFHPRAERAIPRFSLADAQLVTARSYGFASWTKLKQHLSEIAPFVWSGPQPPNPDSDVDVFIRLACLTYTDIHPSPARASRMLSNHQRPLFPELPDFELPPYAIVVSFALVPIAREHGPIEIAPGTHRMRRTEAIDAVDAGQIVMRAVPLALGEVLIRHPWALHRGTPNTTDVPRALCTIRYVRRWYADDSRDVTSIPRSTWDLLTSEQQSLMRFPIGD